uniref:Uncharacterized protein n=1 Tax=Rhizophora mucronata TaxID=61149 RepID=A0A2P2JMY6_RHIMU
MDDNNEEPKVDTSVHVPIRKKTKQENFPWKQILKNQYSRYISLNEEKPQAIIPYKEQSDRGLQKLNNQTLMIEGKLSVRTH